MEQVQIKELAEALGLSIATVHKALKFCPGISYATKDAVLRYAYERGYGLPKMGGIAVILPSNPKLFWHKQETRLKLEMDARGLTPFLTMTYSTVEYGEENDAEVIQCIETAIRTGVSLLITVVPNRENIHRCLMKYADRIMIVIVGEYAEIPNTFYIGENPYLSGYELGKDYLVRYPGRRDFAILRQQGSLKERLQSEGFTRALNEAEGRQYAIWEDMDLFRQKTFLIARKLSEKPLPDCLFDACSNIQQMRDAVYKLKASREVHCIGFSLAEPAELLMEDSILKEMSVPDAEAQRKLLVDNINVFCTTGLMPKTKMLYLPNQRFSGR